MAKYNGYARPKDRKKTMKKMLHYMGIYKWSMVLVGILVCISSLANILGTYMLKPVINKYNVDALVGLGYDFNCGLKAYKNIVIKNIEIYNDMHRYIPYLAKIAGFSKIGEKVVQHQARKYGTTKFGLNRFVNGYLDLITLWFTSKFGKKPMHFFGLWGSVMFFIGFIALVIVLSAKLISICTGDLRPLVTNSPYFYVSLTAMILGTQMFLAGFIGELISRDSPNRNKYKIETEL